MIKIAVTGPESTGKTTLSRQLAERLNGIWVEEFARKFLEKSKGHYTEKDLLTIAQGQVNQFENIDRKTKCVVADTDLNVIMVWAKDKFGRVDPGIVHLWEDEQWDITFLLYPDIPWEPDLLREDPFRREELFEKYQLQLEEKGGRYHVLKGKDKLGQALKLIND